MTDIPRGFDPTATQPSPLTFVRVACRRCISEAVPDQGCRVCDGDVFRAIRVFALQPEIPAADRAEMKTPPEQS